MMTTIGLVVLTAVIFVVYSDLQYLSPHTPYPDALNYYLPYSKIFADQGLAFLKDVRSSYVLPLTYIYPALFQGDIYAIKVANIILHALSVLIVFRIGSNLHSRWAGQHPQFYFPLCR
jgi:hypothetical protein